MKHETIQIEGFLFVCLFVSCSVSCPLLMRGIYSSNMEVNDYGKLPSQLVSIAKLLTEFYILNSTFNCLKCFDIFMFAATWTLTGWKGSIKYIFNNLNK